MNHLQNDLTVFNQLEPIVSAINNIAKRLSDAQRIAGHEGFGAANVIYDDFKKAHENGIQNASASYEKLQKRYAAQGTNGGRKSNPEV